MKIRDRATRLTLNIFLPIVLLAAAGCVTKPAGSTKDLPSAEFLPATGTPRPSDTSVSRPTPTRVMPTPTATLSVPVAAAHTPSPTSVSSQNQNRIPILGASPLMTQTITLMSQYGGQNGNVVLRDHYALTTIGPRLFVFDVADPYNPRVVGQTQVLIGDHGPLAVSGNLAYLAARTGLCILDISEPTNPALIQCHNYEEIGGAVNIGHGGPMEIGGMAISGHIVYLASPVGLLMINISDPYELKSIGIYCEGGCFSSGVHIDGDWAYRTTSDRTEIIDISNPLNSITLEEVGSLPKGKIQIVGDRAYVGSGKTDIFDVSNPRNPVQIGTFSVGASVVARTIVEDTAYLLDAEGRIHVWNVVDPEHPYVMGVQELSRKGTTITVSRSRVAGTERILAYIGWGGLGIVDVTDPAKPVELDSFKTLGPAWDVAVLGACADKPESSDPDYVYVVCEEGLCLVDVSDPSNPRWVSAFSDWEQATEVSVVGTLALIQVAPYSAESPLRRLSIVDVSNPFSPREIGSYPHPGPLRVVGDTVYLAEKGLRIVDISDPAHPKRIGRTPSDERVDAVDVDIEAGIAYLAIHDLSVVDVSDPTAPREVGRFEPPEDDLFQSVLAAQDGIVYVRAYRSGVMVLDASDPSQPKFKGLSYKWFYWKSKPFRTENTVYALSLGQLNAVDISDPLSPGIIATYDWDFDTYSSTLAGRGGTLFMAAQNGGLFVFSMDD